MQTEAIFEGRLSSADISLTNSAKSQMLKLFDQIDDDDVEAIRLYVTGGGCSGMTYGMTFADRKHPHDTVLESDSFNVYVDAVALNYVRGVEIDFVERPTGSTFVFNNVFAATGGSGACGACGAAGGGCGI